MTTRPQTMMEAEPASEGEERLYDAEVWHRNTSDGEVVSLANWTFQTWDEADFWLRNREIGRPLWASVTGTITHRRKAVVRWTSSTGHQIEDHFTQPFHFDGYIMSQSEPIVAVDDMVAIVGASLVRVVSEVVS